MRGVWEEVVLCGGGGREESEFWGGCWVRGLCVLCERCVRGVSALTSALVYV